MSVYTQKYELSFDVLLIRISRQVQEISPFLCTCRSSRVSILKVAVSQTCIQCKVLRRKLDYGVLGALFSTFKMLWDVPIGHIMNMVGGEKYYNLAKLVDLILTLSL